MALYGSHGPASGKLFEEETMPGGKHIFYFVGKEPLALRVVAPLLFANTFLMLFLDSGRKYFHPKHVPAIVKSYGDYSIAVQFVLLAVLAAIFIIFRKRVHHVRRK